MSGSDVIVIKLKSGELKSSPFHVKFRPLNVSR